MTDLDNQSIEPQPALQINRVLALRDELQNSEQVYRIGNISFAEDYLVVMVDIPLNQIFLVNIDSTPKFPLSVDYSLVCSAIKRGELEVLEMEWQREVYLPLEDLPESRKKRLCLGSS